MSNKFKKVDAKGRELPEEIGQGYNYEHVLVKDYVRERVNFFLEKEDKELFIDFCKNKGGMTKVLTNYIKYCIKKE